MDTIVVNLTELYQIIREMRKHDMSYIELSIAPPDEFAGEQYPASLDIAGIKSSEPSVRVEYDSIDAVDVPPPSGGISSNLIK